MKIYHITLLLLVISILIMTGCAVERLSENGLPHINIPNRKAGKKVKADDWLKLEIVPLETTPRSLISENFQQIQIIGDSIYIIDAEVPESIYIFESDGRFIKKLKFSTTPFQGFSSISHTSFFPEKQQIELYDRSSNLEITISVKGQFLHRRQATFPYKYKAALMDDLTIYDCMGLASPRWNIKKPDYNTYALLVLKDADQPISNLWPYPPVINKYPSYEPFDFFYCLHNRVHYYRPFCDTVFTVFPLQLQGKYLIRYKNNPHPASLLTDPFIQDKEAYCIQNRHPFTSQVFETKSHLVIFYNYMEMRNCFIFDKDLQQAILNAKGLYFKDQGLLIPPPITDAGNGKDLVRLISSTEIKQIFKRAHKKGKLPEPYRKIYQDLQDSDNPLLIRYSLKE